MRACVVALFALAGCSSTSSTSTTTPPGDGGGIADSSAATDGGPTDAGAANPDQEKAYCDAVASHATCGGGGSTDTCLESSKCLYGRLMTSVAAAAYDACYSAPSCKSDDDCVNEAGKAAAGNDASTSYTNDCLAKTNECSLTSKNELCGAAVFAYTGTGEAFKACLAKTCSEIEACWDTALAPIKSCKG
jgi:hypothetical protein